MSKYFNICTLLTIFGIVSVSHALFGPLSLRNLSSGLRHFEFVSKIAFAVAIQALSTSGDSQQLNISVETKLTNDGILKVITCNGSKYKVDFPYVLSIKKHPYEKPKGLSDDEVKIIRNQVLEQSNMYRKRHDCNQITLDEDLNNDAQEWANSLAEKNKLARRTDKKNGIFGENVFGSSPYDNIGKIAVNSWYNQLRFMKGDETEDELCSNPKIGESIQLLWKNSKQMGVGVARNEINDHYFIVTVQNPMGNIYLFIQDNLPKIETKHIKEAQEAYEKTSEAIKTLFFENEQLKEQVPAYYCADGEIVTQKYDDSQIGKSNVSNVSHMLKEVATFYGKETIVKMPDEKEPFPFGNVETFNLTIDELKDIRKDVLAKTNYYRRIHGMKLLELNTDMNNYAQDWAVNLAKKDLYEQRKPDPLEIQYGEIIYKSPKYEFVGEIAVDSWYYKIGLLDIKNYNDKLYSVQPIPIFTQLLWKGSSKMGVGAAVNESGDVIIVAYFNPRGNIRYFYFDNIPRFTQDQIDNGKRLQQVLDDVQSVPEPENGQPLKLPGWKTMLHQKLEETKEIHVT